MIVQAQISIQKGQALAPCLVVTENDRQGRISGRAKPRTRETQDKEGHPQVSFHQGREVLTVHEVGSGRDC